MKTKNLVESMCTQRPEECAHYSGRNGNIETCGNPRGVVLARGGGMMCQLMRNKTCPDFSPRYNPCSESKQEQCNGQYIQLSFHVARTPCPEEYYMGVSASYDAFIVNVPEEAIPKELLEVINGSDPSKHITGIAVVK